MGINKFKQGFSVSEYRHRESLFLLMGLYIVIMDGKAYNKFKVHSPEGHVLRDAWMGAEKEE